MPPKKKSTSVSASAEKKADEKKGTGANGGSAKKRKEPPSAPREGSRKSARSAGSRPSQEQLLNFMLSGDAVELCRTEDEAKDLENKGNETVTYSSSVLNPYQELICAIVLSRPISHMLGLRTIRTIFNAPYEFNSAKETKAAGSQKQHQALWDARTQHKDKTAQQIGEVADIVLEKFTSGDDEKGERLGLVLGQSDVDEALDKLKTEIKGLGPTGLDIFLRRVQWLWPHAFPYLDARSAKGLRALGLPDDAEELNSALDRNWSKLDKSNLLGQDDEEQKRRAFVVVLERATAADLGDNAGALMNAAATS